MLGVGVEAMNTDRELAIKIVFGDGGKEPRLEGIDTDWQIERIEQALSQRYKDGLRRGKEIAERCNLGNGDIADEIARAIQEEIEK